MFRLQPLFSADLSQLMYFPNFAFVEMKKLVIVVVITTTIIILLLQKTCMAAFFFFNLFSFKMLRTSYKKGNIEHVSVF